MAKKPAMECEGPEAEDEFEKGVTTDATMDYGTPVKYDPNMGSYPKGTSPGLGRVYEKYADAYLNNEGEARTVHPESRSV